MKKYKALVMLFLLTGLVSSCTTGTYLAETKSAAAYEYNPDPTPVIPEDDESYGMVNLDRKIIMNGDITLEVNDIDSVIDQLVEVALAYDGYILSADHKATILRVQAGKFKSALEEAKTMGTLTDQRIYGEDITESYFDLELRLSNAQKARTRYLELLQEAQTTDETLRVERELERLNGTIDSIKGRLKKMAHLETYATITVRYDLAEELVVEEKVKPGIISYVGIGVYKGVKWLFVRN